jgi:hypothetical protein
METENWLCPRMSPYLLSHLQKYRLSALIPSEGDSRNQLPIEPKTGLKGFISYEKYRPQPETGVGEEACYFCKKLSVPLQAHSRCGDCKKVVCVDCRFGCGKCGKVLCQFDRSYDYSLEQDCCFDC